MKINPNLGANLEQQDFQKSPAGQSPAPDASQFDKLESFDANKFAFGDFLRTNVRSDFTTASEFVFGGRNEGFGLNPDINQAFDTPEEEVNTDSGWFDSAGQAVIDYGKQSGGWFGTGLEYLGEGIKDTPEAFDTIGEYMGKGILGAIEGMSAAAEGIDTGVKWVAGGIAEGASWIGEQVDDAVTSWATQTWDGIVNGAETLGSAIEDALDW